MLIIIIIQMQVTGGAWLCFACLCTLWIIISCLGMEKEKDYWKWVPSERINELKEQKEEEQLIKGYTRQNNYNNVGNS